MDIVIHYPILYTGWWYLRHLFIQIHILKYLENIYLGYELIMSKDDDIVIY